MFEWASRLPVRLYFIDHFSKTSYEKRVFAQSFRSVSSFTLSIKQANSLGEFPRDGGENSDVIHDLDAKLQQ